MNGQPDLPSINHLYSTTTPIKFADSSGHATGFFYNHDEETYLITNRHVLYDPEDDHNPEEIRIFIRNFHDLTELEPIDVSIDDWIEPPQNEGRDDLVDLAALPLGMRLDTIENAGENQTGSLAFEEVDVLYDELKITGGEDIAIVGYPILHRSDWPIIRKGLLATPYWSGYPDDPSFVTDAWMFDGTSGSPIVTSPRGFYRTSGQTIKNPKTYLLGVHSHTLQQRSSNDELQTMGLNTGWNANIIPAMLSE